MADEKRLVFTFGRFNPPTVGHFELVQAVAKEAGKDDYWIFPSHTQDKKKNPLSFGTKVKWMKEMFFKYRKHIWEGDPELKTAFKVCEHFQGHYQHICMIVGSDRKESFTKALNAANGKTHTFKTIEVKSPLKTRTSSDKDLEDYDIFDDTSTMSGSLMRKFADNDMPSKFMLGVRGLLNTWDSLQLMNDVRTGE